MQKLEVSFQLVVVVTRSDGGGPEKRVIVWEGRKQYAKEEANSCGDSLVNEP